MHEISPVLAGTFDAADYLPPVSNVNANANSTAGVDDSDITSKIGSSASNEARRYSKFDHSAADVQTVDNFTFSDFLDLVNPLQHIPGVSSIYRAATGDTINPVSRIAGDILYGGALGAVSAVVGGVSAVGDAVMETQTGKDATGYAIASIFGTGDDKTGGKAADIQLADAKPALNTPVAAIASTPTTDPTSSAIAAMTAASVAAVTQAPAPSAPVATIAATINPAAASAAVKTAASVSAASVASTAPITSTGKAIPLDRSKQPFGGVMDMGNNIESQNRIIALSEGSHAMRLGNTIYTGRLMNGPHPLPVATPKAIDTATANAGTTGAAASANTSVGATSPAATPAAVQAANAAAQFAPLAPDASSAATSNTVLPAVNGNIALTTPNANLSAASGTGAIAMTHHNPLPQNLVDDMVMMKALGQYKGTAMGPSALGSTLDISN